MIGEIDLIRALGTAGIACAAVARPGNAARFSRHTVAVVELADPWSEAKLLVARLLAFAQTREERPVLFYDGDWDLLLVSRHRAELADGFRFVVADSELVEALVDKELFRVLAQNLELPVPASRTILAGVPTEVEDLRFPVVVKPLTRRHASWRPLERAKARRVENAEELAALCAGLADAGVDVLVQELVEGPESRIESYHVYVDPDGEIAGEFTGRKLRTYPSEYGYTTALVISDASDVRALGREVIAKLELRGVAKLDFKRGPDGRLHLLEVNPRFSLWNSPGAVAGVNIPALVFSDLTGIPRARPSVARPGVRWCNVEKDLRAAMHQNVAPLAWLGWAVGSETKGVLSLRDPMPLLGAVGSRLLRRAG